jgi:holin-like protein
MTALRGLACLLLLQAIGEALVRGLGWPIPGPVAGLLLLLPALRLAPIRAAIASAAELLLAHLSLLFVPVGVGVVTHLRLLEHYGIELLVVIVLSTWIGMAVTALVLRALLAKAPPAGDRHG